MISFLTTDASLSVESYECKVSKEEEIYKSKHAKKWGTYLG